MVTQEERGCYSFTVSSSLLTAFLLLLFVCKVSSAYKQLYCIYELLLFCPFTFLRFFP
ncbi:hypothetical protein GCWU000342_01361 [Shuttleworthella satelles DSM 14600]|uniref:Uncharacterized protein n=1 Tax=Shuttleworthella satelles DSM 14600 TaxID=626523 RepID=C4GBQ8_9FIRM|nr:hypothetical protein GCWU000342_01361 [Shuttleworthia satelles DSM 14600]